MPPAQQPTPRTSSPVLLPALQAVRGAWLVPRPLVLLVLLGWLLLLLGGLALLWRSTPPLLVDVGSPADVRFVQNMHAAEEQGAKTYRWTAPAAQLRFVAPTASATMLDLHLDATYLLQQQPATQLVLRHHDLPLGTLPLAPGARTYRVLLPAAALQTTGFAPVVLSLDSPTVRPPRGDDRYLGVVLDWYRVEPIGGSDAQALFARLVLVGGVLLGLAVLWLLLLVLARGLTVWSRTGTLPRQSFAVRQFGGQRNDWLWLLLPLLGLGAGVRWWTWHHHPLPPDVPIGAGVLLAVWLAVLLLGLACVLLLGRAHRVGLPGAGAIVGRWRNWRNWRNWRLPVLIGLSGLAAVLLLLPGVPVVLRGAAALLLLWLPGALLAVLLLRQIATPLEQIWVAAVGAVLLPALLVYGLHALPGALPRGGLWLASVALLGGLLYWLWRTRTQPLATPAHNAPLLLTPQLVLLALIVVLGGSYRLLGLGSAELQGDEVRPLLVAAGIAAGHEDILLLRTKGPVESLVPAAPLILANVAPEWLVRLPFALAGLALIPGVYLLAVRVLHDPTQPHRQLGAWVGVLAATLIAVDGLLIGFGRIVQYQSVVLLLTLAAVWCGWHFAHAAPHPRRLLLIGAVLLAMALLAHYDTLVLLAAPLWLVLWGGWRRGWRGGQWFSGLLPPVLLGSGLVASFYLPYFLHEWVSRNTTVYLLWRVRGQSEASMPFNNLGTYFDIATFYSTTFLIGAAAATLYASVLAWLWLHARPHSARPRWRAVGLGGLWLIGGAVAAFAPHLLLVGDERSLALLVVGLPLLWLVVQPATPAGLRVLLLLWVPPFLAMTFLVGDPRTHFYTMHPGGALLVGAGGVLLVQALLTTSRPALRWLLPPLATAGVVVLLLTLPYLALLFLRQTPEYQRVFPAARPALYRSTYGDVRPRGGYFGFPTRDGWKVAGVLFAQGQLAGSYDSNEKQHRTAWYTRGTFYCTDGPDYVLRTYLDDSFAPKGFQLAGYVLVDDERRLEIYHRTAPATPLLLELNRASIAAFDALPATGFPLQNNFPQPTPQQRVAARWQNGARLVGYDYWAPAAPDQPATIALYWQADAPLDPAYAPVLRVGDAPATPFCNPAPVAGWHTPGVVHQTAFHLPAGAAPVQIGLQHQQSEAWLPLDDGQPWLPLDLPTTP